MGEEAKLQPGASFSWQGCVLVIVIFLVIAAIAIPNLIEARKHRGEAAPFGALKTIQTAQSLFREGDKEGDGNFDYGTLQELSDQTLVDGVLGSGTKQGYFFRVWPSSTDPTKAWFATANPCAPGTTGDRYFGLNQEGVVHYRTTRPFQPEEIGPDCAIPKDADTKRVGY